VVAGWGGRIRVLVVDDDPNFVEAATAMLGADKRLEVVGSAFSGEEAVRQVRVLEPDVVAMDIVMPGLDGIEATRLIHDARPDCQVVLVSGSIFREQGDQGEHAAHAAGAAAYVLKARAALDLADVVAAVKPRLAEAPPE